MVTHVNKGVFQAFLGVFIISKRALFIPRALQNERIKIQSLINNNLELDGVMVEYHIYKYRPFHNNMKSIVQTVLNYNNDAIVLLDPRTDILQYAGSSLRAKKTVRQFFKLIEYSGNDPPEPSVLGGQLDKLISEMKRTINDMFSTVILGRNPRRFLIPPYFVAENYGDSWYRLSLKSLKKVCSDKGEYSVVAPIVFKGNLLRGSVLEKIVEDYVEMDECVDMYLIIPYELDEIRVAEDKLLRLAELINKMSSKTSKPIFVNIGEFGNVLVALGADGLVSGICWRATLKMPPLVGGMLPISNTQSQVYFHSIFKKLYIEYTLRFLEEIPYAYSCDCPICQSKKKFSESWIDVIQLFEDIPEYSIHYYYWKIKELEMYYRNPYLLMQDLENGRKLIREYNRRVGDEYFFLDGNLKIRYQIDEGYLERWLNVLRKLISSPNQG